MKNSIDNNQNPKIYTQKTKKNINWIFNSILEYVVAEIK